MTTKTEQFLTRLAEVPDIPSQVFPATVRAIRRQRTFSRMVGAAAALFLIAAGITSYYQLPHLMNRTAVSDEVSTELQTASDYLNGNDIEYNMSRAVLVDLSDF
jgi:hypothetical protein